MPVELLGYSVPQGLGIMKMRKNKEKAAKHKHQQLGVKKKDKKNKNKRADPPPATVVDKSQVQYKSAKEQASWFSETFYSVHGAVLSSLEMAPIPDEAMVELTDGKDHSIENLILHVKNIIGPSWEKILCSESLEGSGVEAGSPSVLVLSSSAIRCVSLLRGLAAFTKECKPGKLFAKHIKVDEQVEALKHRVNIAVGTPNRVKKLIDIGALGLSQVTVVILDMYKDAKGLNLFTVPEVRKEFWELYRLHFYERVLQHKFHICLY